MTRATIYFILSAPLWIAGGLDDDPIRRLIWWAAVLAVEYSGPLLFFAIPALGRSTPPEWNISGSHMAERFALFIILPLDQGILVPGPPVADLEPTGSARL